MLNLMVHYSNVSGGITSESYSIQVPNWARRFPQGYIDSVLAETYRGKRNLCWTFGPLFAVAS